MRLTKILLILCAVLLTASAGFAARGRPHVDTSLGYKVLLSDQNTLLRGVSLSWDGGDPYGSNPKVMPSLESLISLREVYGLNTVHLFLEGDSDGNTNPVGYNAADCDILVQRCAQAGLYLIITIGCNGQNGQIVDLQFCVDFWNFYAPRYKNDTHVIYEAKNEPVAYTCGHWTQEDWDKQVTLYNAMRPNAPDTYLLMFTFQGLNNAGAAINGINYLESQGVDWSNAGVAWHGYTALDAIEDVLNTFSSSTDYPASLCTEFYPGDTEGQYYNSAFESHFVGWMQFQWLTANDADLSSFAYKIETAGTVWTPDHGDWPTLSEPTIPTGYSGVGLFDRGAAKFLTESGDIKATADNYTGTQSDKFIIENVATSVESNMVAVKADNGLYVSTSGETDSLTAESSSVGLNETFQYLELPNEEVVLRSVSTGHLIRSKLGGRWKGVIHADGDNAGIAETNYKPVDGSTPTGPPPPPDEDPPPPPGPFYGTPMAIPGVVEAEDFDYGGEGVAYHDTDPENIMGVYRPDEGVDLETCSEGGVDVGYIANGEWMNYTVDVAQTGNYIITVRYAGGNSSFYIEFDGTNVTGTVPTYETGGWQVWEDINIPVTLSAGVQVMTFYGSSGFNLNKFTITEDSGGSYCGDGTCDPGEDQCNCSDDCGTPPSTETNCSDGIDNDCDGDTDGDDSDCSSSYCGDGTCDPGEDQCNCSDDCGTPPSSESICDDGIDEDCDGNTDCDDIDCDGDPACPDCGVRGDACVDGSDCCSGRCIRGTCK
jgi:hypothetical protein